MELIDIWGCTRLARQWPETVLPPFVDPCQPGVAQACLYLADFFPAPLQPSPEAPSFCDVYKLEAPCSYGQGSGLIYPHLRLYTHAIGARLWN